MARLSILLGRLGISSARCDFPQQAKPDLSTSHLSRCQDHSHGAMELPLEPT
ncbi:predicted protein [Histoplasma mississippiense (nom. inval.)]|uniref:predicted protein n=1 Tax=Ajellomyces capsulatus (strain NAm1 / WU24) TaxID=2059318 RepID=UPI000157BB51|nr:predicted protein [Histoplasma mississippiense (nom. inval.)]EDN05709.1 predicted protein [Histoplasma mississippiense (nom. inval.)]